MKIKNLIFKSNNTWVGTVLRLSLAIVFLPHGLQKTFGLFGGHGFTNTMQFFTENLNLPWIVALSVILIEFLGAISFIIGFATRFWAVGFIGLMIGILITTHWQNGFFMNWFGTQKGEGYQFDLLAIGISIALVIEGSGKFSIDRLFSNETIVK